MKHFKWLVVFGFVLMGFLNLQATVLTFDVKGGDPNGYTQIPQTYGDNVGSVEDAVGYYKVGRGWTKHVKVKYESIDNPANSLNFIGLAAYGNLLNTAFTWGTGGIITLTPDPGYQVRVNSLKLAAYQQNRLADVKVYDNNNALYMDAQPVVPVSGNLKLSDGREKWVKGPIKIRVSELYNITIDEIDFDERPIADTTYSLGDSARAVTPGNREEYLINLPTGLPAGKECRLILDSRLDYPEYSGFGSPMYVYVVTADGVSHGTQASDLLNKENDFITRGLKDWTWYTGGTGGLWRNLFSPDFNVDKVAETTNGYGIPDQLSHPYHYEINLSDYVKAGVNKVRVENYSSAGGYNVMIKNVSVEIGDPLPAPSEVVYPAPAGALTDFVPQVAPDLGMTLFLNSYGDIKYVVDGKEVIIKSKSSNPGGGWTTSSAVINGWLPIAKDATVSASWNSSGSTAYRIDRFVKNAGDHIEVTDRYRNQSGALLGLIIEHEMPLPADYGTPQYKLGGADAQPGAYRRSPGNPTAIALMPTAGKSAGLVADGDIFRVQAYSFVKAGSIGLSTYELGIPAGDSWANWRTLEWSIYPPAAGDYWTTLNSIRKSIGSNYEIPGPIVFAGQDGTQSASYYQNWMQKRGVKWVVSGQAAFTNDEKAQTYSGAAHATYYSYGTALEYATTWLANTGNWAKKLHSLMPEAKVLIYFHSNLSSHPATWNPAFTGYQDSRMLDANGTIYRYSVDAPINAYLSTSTNGYGAAIRGVFDRVLARTDLDINGINGDEFYWSQTDLSYPDASGDNWDQTTVKMDEGNFNVIQKMTRQSLLQLSHRSSMVDYAKSNGKVMIMSGPAETKTMLSKKLPTYAETSTYTELYDMHLSAPLGYGNHDPRPNDISRSKMVRKMLDKGGLLLVSNWTDEPVGQHYIPLMYPMTPIELREGMVIGKERIISNKSGIYGWPEGYDANVYVFNGNGQLVTTPNVVKNGTQWSVRMPSDHFVILVKK